jgi:hypothetical protein
MDIYFATDELPETLAMARRLEVRDAIIVGITDKQLRTLRAHKTPRLFFASFVEPAKFSAISKQGIFIAETSRAAAEHPQITALIGAEALEHHDKLHQRAGGIDIGMAKKAAANGKVLLLDARLLHTSRRAQAFGRMRQNVLIAQSAKLPMLVVSAAHNPFEVRDAHSLACIARLLGIPSLSIRQAQTILCAALEKTPQ